MNQPVIADVDSRPDGAAGSERGEGPSTWRRPYFEPDLVVSRDAEGKLASRYGDPCWDYRSQSTDGASAASLQFFTIEGGTDHGLAAIIREQQKALMWLHIDAGKVRALMTIQLANRTAYAWCQIAMRRGVELFELLANPTWIAEELRSRHRTHVWQTASLVKTLWRHAKALGMGVQIPLQELRAVVQAESQARSDDRQTPLIPSSIYCAILGRLVAGLEEIERDLDEVLDAYRQSITSSRSAPASGSKMQRKTFRARAMVQVAERMKRFGYAPREAWALDKFIAGRINFIQSQLMHTVAGLSGMRVGEVCILPLHDVVETFEDRGSVHYVIKGFTHKLNHGVKKPTTWITSREGYRAILLAQRIAATILDVVGGEPQKGQQALLFCSSANPFMKKSNNYLCRCRGQLIEAICPLITQGDIDELDHLELERGWQRDGIEVGKRWPLAFHQLRRSLSVYAHRSGMVSLPVLKAQLQHVTDEMRAYYADGYSRAVNLVWDPDHFSHEWNAAKAESSYFGYTLGLLLSDDDLMGRGAERLAATVATRSRNDTLSLFKDGKLAYKETVLGGCISTEECNAKPLEPIPFECLETDCVNQVVHAKRLEYVISTQEMVVATLERDDCGSVEQRLEVENLRVLLKARQRFMERRT